MADLVTLEQYKAHKKLGDLPPAAAVDLQLKLDAAEEVVLQHIARPSDADWTAEMDTWTETTVPSRIKLAILEQCADMDRFRGDDAVADAPKVEHGYLAPVVARLLHHYRDPALA